MPVRNRIAELAPEIARWRRDFHAHPELQFEVHRTAARVAELLREMGCDRVETGIGRAANVALASLPGFTLPGDTSASSRFYTLDVTEPFTMDSDGMMTVPSGPGLGVAPIPEILDEVTVWRADLTAG